MKRLKIVLNYKITYFILGLLIFFYVITMAYIFKEKSIYTEGEIQDIFVLDDINVSDDKISMILKGKEDIIGTIYTKQLDNLEDIKEGIKVSVRGTLFQPSNSTIPYNFNYRKYLNNHGIYYLMKIDKIEVIDSRIGLLYQLRNYINKRLEKIDKKGYLKAFILGNKDNIDDKIYSLYQLLGVTHLFALSGMHIGLFSNILLKLFNRLNMKIKYILVDLVLIFYGCIVGFPVSIKRCLLFFILNTFNKIFKLNVSSFRILFISVCLLILFNYRIVYDIAFLYSVSTVGGILLLQDFINCNNKLISSFKLSLVAFLFSLPITLNNFYCINLLSILYNIIYIPYISMIVYPLSLLSFIFKPLVYLFDFSISILENVSFVFSNIDIFIIFLRLNFIFIFIYYFLLLFSFIKRKYRYLWLILLIFIINLIWPYFDTNNYIYYFDVGQGDSSLIITAKRKEVILIDTGGISTYGSSSNYYVSDKILTFLKANGISKIDILIISHGDYDHMGEVSNIINNIKVNKVIFNIDSYNELEKELIEILEEKGINYYKGLNELKLDEGKIYFLNTKEYDNENDNSNVLYFKLNNYQFLFMGDAGIDREKDLLDKYNLSDIDFIKIGHHGSNTSSNEYFIDSIKPKNCVISVGKNNRYGHPKDEVLNTLDDYCNIYRTDLDGSIEIKINKNSYKIKIYSP